MSMSESLKIAIKSIKANWLRSLLTMLGIIIGVSSVIMIVGAGTGVRNYIVDLIEDLGSNAILVSVDTALANDNDYITLDDVENIKTQVKGVERCSPMLLSFGSATIDSLETEATIMFVGVNSELQFALDDGINYGRFFSPNEYNAGSPVAVIGSSSAKNTYGYEDVANEYITVSFGGRGMKLRLCGVANIDAITSSIGGSSFLKGMISNDDDRHMIVLLLPCTTLSQITGDDISLSSVFVIAQEGFDYDAVGNATVNYLKSAHGNFSTDMYKSQNMATYVELVDTIMSLLTMFIAGVGAISLIVGGIGVMNIMLVSVTERTREIGIRKSLGAKTRVITLQFLTESVILCLIGGAIGVVLGIIGAYLACSVIDLKPNITWWIISLALLFSSGVGLFFGIYPAKKAAKLSPIDALRSE